MNKYFICHSLRAGKGSTADDHGNFPSIAGKENSFLRCCQSSADDENIHSCEKLTITGGTITDAPTSIFFFSYKAHFARLGACGYNYSQSLQLPLSSPDLFNILR